MYPCTREILDQILYLIERDKCSQAVQVWSDYRRDELQACGNCHYDNFGMEGHDCCMCLESKLRTLSLYQNMAGTSEAALQNAARKLHVYQGHCA